MVIAMKMQTDLVSGGCATGAYNDRFVNVGNTDLVIDTVKDLVVVQMDDPIISGCVDSDASDYNSDATVQALDEYGNALCTYASCDDAPVQVGNLYATSFAEYNEVFWSN